MARTSPQSVVALAATYFPSFLRSRADAIALDAWCNGKQYDITDDSESAFYGRPYSPNQGNSLSDEYDDLSRRTPTPWAGLIVTSLAQTAYVDGVRMPGKQDNMNVWKTWQHNRMDARQAAVHRAAIGMGSAYGVALPGVDPLTREPMARMIGKSAKRMAAFYDDEADEWPVLAIEGKPRYNQISKVREGWQVKVYLPYEIHNLTCKMDGTEETDWTWVSVENHPLGVTPVARLANRLDLDGKAVGEIEPVLPLLKRIDQDTFDRLIVQRFGAWKVRYISGMAKPDSTTMANLQALKLKVEDLLISSDHQTKFGTLDATDPNGFIAAHDADLRVLSAITQTPPHHLLGLSSNLQAEALAAAESGLMRKSADFRTNAGEFWEQMFRMSAMLGGDVEEARAFDMQVRWRDTESRSLTQAADALGKLAVQLKVPVEMLWEKIPGWTDSDTERAKNLLESGALDQLLSLFEQQGSTGQQQQGGQGGTAQQQ